MGIDMSVAELLGSLTLETQIIIGLVFLFTLLTAVQVAYLRSIRAREEVQAERAMNAQLSRVISLLEGKGKRSANGRILPSEARFRPVKRTSDRTVPAARCPRSAPVQRGPGARRRA
jgi:hypothetical protein